MESMVIAKVRIGLFDTHNEAYVLRKCAEVKVLFCMRQSIGRNSRRDVDLCMPTLRLNSCMPVISLNCDDRIERKLAVDLRSRSEHCHSRCRIDINMNDTLCLELRIVK